MIKRIEDVIDASIFRKRKKNGVKQNEIKLKQQQRWKMM